MTDGISMADAMLREAECFGNDQPLVTMIRALALGLRNRSPSVLAAIQAASMQREPWQDEPPDLSGRELEMVMLLAAELGRSGDRRAAQDQLSNRPQPHKALCRKLGASSRALVVARALQLGLVRLGGGADAVVALSSRAGAGGLPASRRSMTETWLVRLFPVKTGLV